MDRFWTPWRLRWYPVAIIVAIAAGFVVHVASAQDTATLSGRLGGDFPAFYGAGSIVADGDIGDLYDLDRQIEAQRELFPSGTEVLYFAYPPHVAVTYRLLVPLGFAGAYVVHTALSLLALWGAIALAEPLLPVLRGRRLAAFASSLLFLPLTEGAFLGQNVAFSLFFVVAAWRLVEDDRPWAGGAVLGLLAYKPQLLVPLAGLYLVSGRWRVTLGAGATTAGAVAAATALMGTDWVADWVDQARAFNDLDIEVNGDLAISAVGFFSNLALDVVGWAVAAIAAAVMVWVWWGRGELRVAVAVAAAGAVVMAPHAQQYESGLMLVTLAVLADNAKPVAWIWLAVAARLLAGTVGFNPAALAVVAGFALAVQLHRSRVEVAG